MAQRESKLNHGTKKRITSLVLVLICLAAWGIEVKWVNCFFDQNSPQRVRMEYHVGETVELGSNEYVLKQSAPSCHITVESFEAVDYDDYVVGNSFTGKVFEGEMNERKLLLVTINITADKKEEIQINELICYGMDAVFNQEWSLLQQINEELDDSMRLAVEPGRSYHITMPFVLYKVYLSSAWEKLDDYPIWLRITIRPEEKIVRIQ